MATSAVDTRQIPFEGRVQLLELVAQLRQLRLFDVFLHFEELLLRVLLDWSRWLLGGHLLGRSDMWLPGGRLRWRLALTLDLRLLRRSFPSRSSVVLAAALSLGLLLDLILSLCLLACLLSSLVVFLIAIVDLYGLVLGRSSFTLARQLSSRIAPCTVLLR